MSYKISNSYEDFRYLQEERDQKEISEIRREKSRVLKKSLLEVNHEIVYLYDYIINKYESRIIGIPGLKEIILLWVCPSEIIEKIRKETH